MQYSRSGRPARLWLSVLTVSASLVSATGLTSPGFAAPLEVSALTPGLVDGFNEETIREFVDKNPYEGELRFGLSAEDREQIIRLGLTAVEFRKAVAGSGITEGNVLTQSARDLITAALDLGQGGPPPALWRSFFQGSIVALGNALAPVKRIGFYNPQVDGWLMTDWSETDGDLALAAVHSVTGALLRGEPEPGLQLPAWTRMSDKSIIGALAQVHGKTVAAFRSRHPVTSRQAPPPASFDTHRQRQIIEVRLGAMRRSLNVLGRPAIRTATREFERQHVRKVLVSLGHNKNATAESLGIGLSSLYRKLEELGISKTAGEPSRMT